jgi:drug/metabolite transporter (DMT)-like permease
MRPILLGVLAAFFFAFTFLLNRMMDLEGGSWIWSASLRYFFMVPPLIVIVAFRRGLGTLWQEMKKKPLEWLLWSTVGFGLFYGPLCFAASYGPGWLMAATWQITIISGSLLAPFFYETIQTARGPVQIRGHIPARGLAMSSLILLGVALTQFEHAARIPFTDVLLCVIPITIASFAYPLGNRKMMAIVSDRLDAYQRVLGMTFASLPFWFMLSLYGAAVDGPPSFGQIVQTGWVALFSGVIATVMFFAATDMVKGDIQKLCAIEATQSSEVLFALLGEMIVLSAPLPSPISWVGICLVVAGMILHSYLSRPKKEPEKKMLSI